MKIKTFKLLTIATAATAAWMTGMTSASGALLIDDFDSVQVASDTSSGGVSVFSHLLDAGVLGGSRQFEANKTGGGGASIAVSDISDGGADPDATHRFVFDQSGSQAFGKGWIRYDGVDNDALDATGFSPAVDLTQGGTLVNFTFKDVNVVGPNLKLTVTLYDKTSGLPSAIVPLVLTAGFIGDINIPYASFSNALTAANVGAIEILIDGSGTGAHGSDVSFDLLTSTGTPEPTSLAFIGAAGFGLIRRRKA